MLFSGLGWGCIDRLDAYENLHMGAWVQDSAALAGSRAAEITRVIIPHVI